MQKLEIISLNDLKIANPCPANWNEMTGDEHVRHCKLCEKNVYNLSSIPEQDAIDLVNKHEGNLCGRLYLRKDGTVIVNDCPVGFSQVAADGIKLVASVCKVLLMIVCGLAFLFGGWVFFANASETVASNWDNFVSTSRRWMGLSSNCITGKISSPPSLTIPPPLPPPLPKMKTPSEM
ncbi:hypothetical protein MNBD_PLANCTO02-1256 [hydrothermal vent metagenome]|uniref:Uncharacterized protein n=1 Tax=hydrothermal vent metagenome TaxID=652676 RepID=A0A3B1E7Y6_9ZZZZ